MNKGYVAALLGMMTSFVMAQSPNEPGLDYNEVSVGYTSMDVTTSGVKRTLTGYGVTGTYLLSPNFFLQGGHGSTHKTLTNNTKFTVAQSQVGLGVRLPILAHTDGIALISYAATDTTLLTKTTDSTYSVFAGVRSGLHADVDAGLNLVYAKTDKQSAKNGFLVNVKYKFTRNLFVKADYYTVPDLNRYTVGLGYRF